jgi:hypothetical protein
MGGSSKRVGGQNFHPNQLTEEWVPRELRNAPKLPSQQIPVLRRLDDGQDVAALPQK